MHGLSLAQSVVSLAPLVWSAPRRLRRGRLRIGVYGLGALLASGCAFTAPLGAAIRRGSNGTSVPSHIETWAYDDSNSSGSCNGGFGASRSLIRQWLTYAETNCGPHARKALRDCRARSVSYCSVLTYLDANLIWPGNPLITRGATHEDWWLHQPGHTDSRHRLTVPGSDGRGYVLNQSTPAVWHWVQHYLRARFNRWDGVFMDDTGASTAAQFWRSGHLSSEEITTNSGILTEHRRLAARLTHSHGSPFLQVDNGINVNPYVKPTFPLLNHPSSVVGLVAEGEPWDHGAQPYYSTLLDDMAYVDSTRRDFIVLAPYDQAGSAAARRFQEATVLLGYEPGHAVDWADLEQDSLDLSIWPEEGVYPTQPLQAMGAPRGRRCLTGTGVVCARGGHNDVEVAPGVYRREFGACYDRGAPFGRCAVIVNDTATAVTVSPAWLMQLYAHQITMGGGDVQSGGTINTTGALFVAGVTQVPPDDALLLAQ